MCPILEDSDPWKMYYAVIELLKDIYLQNKTEHPNDREDLMHLINFINTQGAYLYRSAPDYKHYFLSYYLCLAVNEEQSTILGFLNFLLLNGANLNGAHQVKDFLLRALFKQQKYFDLFLYLIEKQGFKLEENLTLIPNAAREEKNLKAFAYEQKLHDIYTKYEGGTIKSDDEIVFITEDIKGIEDINVHLIKPNSVTYLSSKKYFLYYDFSGRLKYCTYREVTADVIKYTTELATLFGQDELIASHTNIECVNLLMQQDLPILPQKEHPIHLVYQYPNSQFSTYFLEHCTSITYAHDSPLIVATRFKAHELMYVLLEKNPYTINYRNSRNEDAVAIAIQQNDSMALKILFEGRPSVLTINNTTTKLTAFHVAALFQRLEHLRDLAAYAKTTDKQFGQLVKNESNTFFHWILNKKLLTNTELVTFISQCDSKEPEDEHGKKMEGIIYDLLSVAYASKNRELTKRLISYLKTSNRFHDYSSLIIKIISLTITQPIILFPESLGIRKRTAANLFCDEYELQYFIELMFDCMTEDLYILELSRLALFACKQNKVNVARQLISSHKANLSSVVSNGDRLMRELLSAQAYASAQWLLEQHHDLPNMGFNDLQAFVLETISEQGNYGHTLLLENQPALLLALLSRGYLDSVLQIPNKKDKTLLEIALTKKQDAVSLAVAARIQKSGLPLEECCDEEERLLLVKLFKLKNMSGFILLAYRCFKHDIKRFIALMNGVDANQTDSQGRILLHDLLDDHLAGLLSMDSLLEYIRHLKLKLTPLDANQSGLLIWACERENLPLIKQCLKNKTWNQHQVLDGRSSDQLSALDVAYVKKNKPLFEVLWKEIPKHIKELHITSIKRNADQRNQGAQERLRYLVELKITTVASPRISVASATAIEDPVSKNYKDIIRAIKSEVGAKKVLERLEADTPEINAVYEQFGLNLLMETLQAKRTKILKRLLHISSLQQTASAHIDALLINIKEQDNAQELITHMVEKIPNFIDIILSKIPSGNDTHELMVYLLGTIPQLPDALLKKCKEHEEQSLMSTLLKHFSFMWDVIRVDPEARAILAPYNNPEYPTIYALYNQLPITVDQITIACTNRDMQAIETLLRADECSNHERKLSDNVVYQDAIAREDYELLNELLLHFHTHHYLPHAEEQFIPMAYAKSSFWRSLISELPKLFTVSSSGSETEKPIEAALSGSSLYTTTPSDLDIRIRINIYDPKEQARLDVLMAKFQEHSEPFEKNPDDNLWGNPTLFGRILTIKWKGISVDLVISQLSCEENARNHADFTFSGMYFNLNTFTMLFVDGINACADLKQKIIRTIQPPEQTFKEDPKRIFRAIRLKVKTNSRFAEECKEALNTIANAEDNLFMGMKHGALSYQIKLALTSDFPKKNIKLLHQLKLLDKIRAAFLNGPVKRGRIALEIEADFLRLTAHYFQQGSPGGPSVARKKAIPAYDSRRPGLRIFQKAESMHQASVSHDAEATRKTK